MTAQSDARTYSAISAVSTAIIGLVVVGYGLIIDMTFVIVIGFISVLFALTSYVLVTERIRTNDLEGARAPCLALGIVLLVFGALIGGIFMLLAHTKLSETGPRWPPPPPYGGEKRPKKTRDEERIVSVGFLTPISGHDAGKPPVAIDRLDMKIGRSSSGAPERGGLQNDIVLSDVDDTQSRDQGRLRVDLDTRKVQIMSEYGRMELNGSLLPPREWTELSDGATLKFGTQDSTWRFSRAGQSGPSPRPTR